MIIDVQPNRQAATHAAARFIAHQLRIKPDSVLGLATGRTMEPVYAQLVELYRSSQLDFSRCRTFNLDEYVGLGANDRNSYRHYMDHHLFFKVNVDSKRTHVPDGLARDLDAECAKYEQLIQQSGGIDLQLLGIGNNGHIGFNEPGSTFDSRTCVKKLSLTTRQQNASHFADSGKMPDRAITTGIGTIMESRQCLLLATGADKAAIIAEALEGRLTTMVPATVLRSHPACTCIIDASAASQLRFPDGSRVSRAA